MARTAMSVHGADVLAAEFTRKAAQVQDEAEDLVVEYADKAAEEMRDTVSVHEGNVRDSITADTRALTATWGVHASAGPDREANDEAFVAVFLENGTVKMVPQPFVGPTADRIEPEFGRAVSKLGGWL